MIKLAITIASLFILTNQASAQRRISYNYIEIKKTQYDSCGKVQCLATNSQLKKQSGKLTIPIANNASKIFKDDNSDTEFKEYKYLGDIKETKLALIKRTDYNSEEFYLVNRITGSVDTLIGQPVFASNMKDFACINNPGTDEKQQIQVCEIKNSSVITILYLNGNGESILQDILCIKKNSILAKDNNGKYWKLSYKITSE